MFALMLIGAARLIAMIVRALRATARSASPTWRRGQLARMRRESLRNQRWDDSERTVVTERSGRGGRL